MFSFGKLGRLLPPPDGAQLGARYRETQHLTDPADLAAHIINSAREEWGLPMSAALSRNQVGAWFFEFDALCPQGLIDNHDLRYELLLRLEDWIERFNWKHGENQCRFSGQIALYEPDEVAEFGITWGAVEAPQNIHWVRLRARLRMALRRSRNSKYMKWFALL